MRQHMDAIAPTCRRSRPTPSPENPHGIKGDHNQKSVAVNQKAIAKTLIKLIPLLQTRQRGAV